MNQALETNVILKIGWLPMKERRDFHLLKLAYKALNYETSPAYLKINEVIHTRPLRSNLAKRLVILLDKGTCQDSAAKRFNSLTTDIRNSDNFNYFCKETEKELKKRICN